MSMFSSNSHVLSAAAGPQAIRPMLLATTQLHNSAPIFVGDMLNNLQPLAYNLARNSREPKNANHGARPCNNRNRRRNRRLRRSPG